MSFTIDDLRPEMPAGCIDAAGERDRSPVNEVAGDINPPLFGNRFTCKAEHSLVVGAEALIMPPASPDRHG